MSSEEVFAYPVDDTGLPVPVKGFPPVPEALLQHIRCDMKNKLKRSNVVKVQMTDVDSLIEWAVSNPFSPEARLFRKCLYTDKVDKVSHKHLEIMFGVAKKSKRIDK